MAMMLWRCPHCKRYYEEIAIDLHKEQCNAESPYDPRSRIRTEHQLHDGESEQES